MTTRFRAFLAHHVAALLLATAVGFVMIASPIAVRVLMETGYRGIGMVLSPSSLDGAWYHAVIREAVEGGKPWNAMLSENKNAPYPVPDLAERVMAFPGRIIAIEPDTLLLAWRFILPFALVLAIYAASVVVVQSRLFGLFASGAAVLFAPFAYDPAGTVSVLAGITSALPYTFVSRPVHPQFESPLVWTFLLMTILAVRRPAAKRYWVLSGVILGVLSWSYFWAWTWGYAVLFIILLTTSQEGFRRARHAVLKAWALGVLLGFPALFRLAASFWSPSDQAYAERLATYHGRAVAAWPILLPLVLALVMLTIRRRRIAHLPLGFAFAGLAATFLAVNQQLITGVSLQPDHYMSLIGSAFIVWAFALSAWSWIARWRFEAATSTVVIALFLGFSLAMGHEIRIFGPHRNYTEALQPFADVASWLNRHGDSRTVVFANQEVGLLIPIYTPANLWWHSYALAIPQDAHRIEHAAFTYFALQSMSPDDVRAFARAYPIPFTQFFTLTTLYEQREKFLAENLERLLVAYDAFRRETSPSSALRTHRIDYILYDKLLDTWNPDMLGVDQAVVDNERFVLYPVMP